MDSDLERILKHMRTQDDLYALQTVEPWMSISDTRMRNLLRAAIDASRQIREEKMEGFLKEDSLG